MTQMLTIEQALVLHSVLTSKIDIKPQETLPAMISGGGRAVIVRSRDAGVQFGYLTGYEGSTVYLTKARQMWQWKAAQGGTLLDCATHGVTKSGSKFSGPVESMIVINVCAIIDCTSEATSKIEAVSWA